MARFFRAAVIPKVFNKNFPLLVNTTSSFPRYLFSKSPAPFKETHPSPENAKPLSGALYYTPGQEQDFFLKDQMDGPNLITAAFTQIEQYDKSNLKSMHCLVSLSIGQPNHYGPRLAATLSLVNRTFGACTFVFGDTLQRHTLAIKNPLETKKSLQRETRAQGDAWIQANNILLSKLDIPWSVKRWHYWLEHKRFPDVLKCIQDAYFNNLTYKSILDENVTEYIERLKKRNESIANEEQARSCCLDYLQEECAAMCLWVEENCQFELYPSVRSKAMQATYECFIKPAYPGILQPISLRFKKKNLSNFVMDAAAIAPN